MATLPMAPGQAGGQATGVQNAGIPVLGNSAGRNQHGPSIGGLPIQGVSAVASPLATGTVPNALPTNYKQMPLGSPSVANTPGVGTLPTTPGQTKPTSQARPLGTSGPLGPISDTTAAGALQGSTDQQQQWIQKQLKDTFGKGEGSLLNNLLMNLGSNNSSYMQAYIQAMSKTKQEGLNTLQTSEGNSGISSDSSVAAIAQSNYESGFDAQIGMQEAQLQQTQMQDTIGLVQGIQGGAQQEVSSGGWLNTISQLVGAGSSIINTAGDAGWL